MTGRRSSEVKARAVGGASSGVVPMTGPRQFADALIVAERERKPIAAFTDAYPFLLPDDERTAGVCLSCRAIPITDIIVELQEGDRLRQVSPFGRKLAGH